MIEILKNCPNCGGILDDAGRCMYCKSKIYDFVGFNIDSSMRAISGKKYIRIRLSEGSIVTLPFMLQHAAIETSVDSCSEIILTGIIPPYEKIIYEKEDK